MKLIQTTHTRHKTSHFGSIPKECVLQHADAAKAEPSPYSWQILNYTWASNKMKHRQNVCPLLSDASIRLFNMSINDLDLKICFYLSNDFIIQAEGRRFL